MIKNEQFFLNSLKSMIQISSILIRKCKTTIICVTPSRRNPNFYTFVTSRGYLWTTKFYFLSCSFSSNVLANCQWRVGVYTYRTLQLRQQQLYIFHSLPSRSVFIYCHATGMPDFSLKVEFSLFDFTKKYMYLF